VHIHILFHKRNLQALRTILETWRSEYWKRNRE